MDEQLLSILESEEISFNEMDELDLTFLDTIEINESEV